MISIRFQTWRQVVLTADYAVQEIGLTQWLDGLSAALADGCNTAVVDPMGDAPDAD